MGRRARLRGLAVIVMGLGALGAAPPKITNVEPPGLERGVAAVLAISGDGLKNHPRLIAPFAFELTPPKPGDGIWKPTIKIASGAAVGVYPIRVQTDQGISNPFLLAVGQFPQVEEKEDDGLFEHATPLPPLPVVAMGRLDGADVDFFRFHGKKGERIVVDAQCARIGSGVDPTIRLTMATANRKYVASADDSPGLQTDARFTTALPADGDYVVEISDSRYQGANRPVYRLVIGAVAVADEVYPLGGRLGETVGLELRGGTIDGVAIAAAMLHSLPGADLAVPRVMLPGLGASDVEIPGALAVSHMPELRESAVGEGVVKAVAPVVFNGRIDPPGDEDRFALEVQPGRRLRIEVQASAFGSALDGTLEVRDEKGGVIASADDAVLNRRGARKNQQAQAYNLPDPSLELTVPGGVKEITLALRDLAGRGGVGYPYRIVVEPMTAEFEITVETSEYTVPKGGWATIPATVKRKGYSGPITLTAVDLPPGLTVREGVVAAGQTTGATSITAALGAAFPPTPIRLVGRAQTAEGAIERSASATMYFIRDADPPVGTMVFEGLMIATAVPAPVALETPANVIELPRGFSAPVPITAARAKDALGALKITALPGPAGVAASPLTIAEKDVSGSLIVKAALDAPLGALALALKAQGKIAGNEQTLDLPIARLNVVDPVALELASAKIQLKPKATFELKGKLVRKGGMNGPVVLKIAGLPAGLKCEPATVAPAAAEFVLKIVAEPKAPAASVKAQVSLAYKVENKDYQTPPHTIEVVVAP